MCFKKIYLFPKKIFFSNEEVPIKDIQNNAKKIENNA